MSFSDYTRINEAINLLIDIKNIFRNNTPIFTMDNEYYQRIKSHLKQLNEVLAKLNENFDIKLPSEANQMMDFEDLIKNKFFIVTTPKKRKKLIAQGFNSAQILETGGIINTSDIETLNPNITESRLKNLQNKIQNFWKILKSKLREKNFSKLILLVEKGNTADEILLKRKNEFEKKLSIPVQSITISSFDEINRSSIAFINS